MLKNKMYLYLIDIMSLTFLMWCIVSIYNRIQKEIIILSYKVWHWLADTECLYDMSKSLLDLIISTIGLSPIIEIQKE